MLLQKQVYSKTRAKEWCVPVFSEAARPAEAEWVKSWMEPDGVSVHAVHAHMAARVPFVSEAGVLYGKRGDPISPRLWCLLLPRFCASSLGRSRSPSHPDEHTCAFCWGEMWARAGSVHGNWPGAQRPRWMSACGRDGTLDGPDSKTDGAMSPALRNIKLLTAFSSVPSTFHSSSESRQELKKKKKTQRAKSQMCREF